MVSNPMQDYLRNLYQQQQAANAARFAQQKTSLDDLLGNYRKKQQERDSKLKQLQEEFGKYAAGLPNSFDKAYEDFFGYKYTGAKTTTATKATLPPKVQKIYDLWSGTSNDGEKSAAEQALKRMGYKIESGKAVKA